MDNELDFAVPVVVQVLRKADYAERSRIITIACQGLGISPDKVVVECQLQQVKLSDDAGEEGISDKFSFLRRMGRFSVVSGYVCGLTTAYAGFFSGLFWGIAIAVVLGFRDLIAEDKETGSTDGWWWKKSLGLALAGLSNASLVDDAKNFVLKED